MTAEVKIEDIIEGTGKAAERGALITAHYRGWLEDGTEFDSSYKRGEPFQIVLSNNRVIQGWILGLKGMKTGGKRKLWVPAALAYGERQIGSMIPPNSNLMFEIELLEVLTRDDWCLQFKDEYSIAFWRLPANNYLITGEFIMPSPLRKDEAHKLIDQLPADATWEDLMEQIYVRQAIEQGLSDSEQGKLQSVQEIRRKYGLTE